MGGGPSGEDDSTLLLQAHSVARVSIDLAGKVDVENHEQIQSSSTPTQCEKKCQCPQVKDSTDFATYFFQADDYDWCFTTYTPQDPNRTAPWPVLLIPLDDAKNNPNNYLKTMIGWSKFQMVPLLISGTKGLWPSGMPKVVTDDRPQPCVDKWMPYMRGLLDWIKGRKTLDDQNVYIFGFSSEGLWTLYVGFCFSTEIKGVFAAGAPITNRSNPHPERVPAKVMYCDPPACQYWPIYPCFDQKLSMKICVASSPNDPWVYPTDLRYRALDWTARVARDEGYDVANIVWGDIKGHAKIGDFQEWVVGCLGINPPCPPECWSGGLRTKLAGCRSCGLTPAMLIGAHPGSSVDGQFGRAQVSDLAKPPTSKCNHNAPDLSGDGGSPEDELPDDYVTPGGDESDLE